MEFAYTDKVEGLRGQIQDFMDMHIVPRIRDWRRKFTPTCIPSPLWKSSKPQPPARVVESLPAGPEAEEPGTPLTNLEYAPLAEIMGRIGWASEAFNCSAPDTGSMELLHMFATEPEEAMAGTALRNGEIRSAFAMTVKYGFV